MHEIRSNTCPYCGGAYTLTAGGCAARCSGSEVVRQLIADAIEEQERGYVHECTLPDKW